MTTPGSWNIISSKNIRTRRRRNYSLPPPPSAPRRFRLGHGIFQLTTNHPARVAEKVAVLDLLSNGRCEFGIAAPQDPVVGGQPEVVELVARVGHALAAAPADRRALRRRQRLRHQDVVVDRHEQRHEAAQPARIGGRRDEDLGRPTRARRRPDRDAAGAAPQPRRPRDPRGSCRRALERRPARPQASLAGSSITSRPGGRSSPAMPERRVDLRLDLLPIQELERARRARPPRRPARKSSTWCGWSRRRGCRSPRGRSRCRRRG